MDRPIITLFNKDQTMCTIASEKDILLLNLSTEFELDIDMKETVGDIQNIMCDKDYFYVFARRKNEDVGHFLFKIPISSPESEYEYLPISDQIDPITGRLSQNFKEGKW